MLENIKRAKKSIEAQFGSMAAKTALVLGSGLGDFVNRHSIVHAMTYSSIDGFLSPSVQGHLGKLCLIKIASKPVLVFCGRIHAYEGHDAKDVTFPIRVIKALNISNLILTNACGSTHKAFKPGQIMLIKNHLNLTGLNPLLGSNVDELGPRFPDMSFPYDQEHIKLAKRLAKKLNISVKIGVYAGLLGPSYETASEIQMLKKLGADVVGMSTVLETIAARHQGTRVVGLSLVSNDGAGIGKAILSHQDVIETQKKNQEKFFIFLSKLCTELS